MPVSFIIIGVVSYITSTLFAAVEFNPFYNLYYIFAWYSYILIVDGVIYLLKRNSLIISRTSEFFYMLILSTGLWFLFEIFNVSLKNWSYIMLPYDPVIRYSGYILSYATVLPAIFETAELIDTIKIFPKIRHKDIYLKFNPRLFLTTGILLTILTLIFPKYLFPLIWVAPLLITETLNIKLGTRSLVKEIISGNLDRVLNIGFSGIICGILWEFWNFKAGSKWIYHLPYLNSPKIFEMPVAGYIGFIFFAFECYSIYNLLSYFKSGITWEEDLQLPTINRKFKFYYPIFLLATILISIIAINLIDKFSVKVYTIF